MHRACVVGVVVLSLLVASGCHRTKRYETDIEVTRMTAVRKDEHGKVQTVDLEVTYVDCPGTQSEVMRGDASFAACLSKYKVGERIHVELDHLWHDEGHYEWKVRKVGDCEHVIDPNDEASYAMVRECSDWDVNGTRVGFQCKYTPEKALIQKCPWFRRR